MRKRLGLPSGQPSAACGARRGARYSRKPARREATISEAPRAQRCRIPPRCFLISEPNGNPNQSHPPCGGRQPTFTSHRAWSRGARTRGTNRQAAPNGRETSDLCDVTKLAGSVPSSAPRPSGSRPLATAQPIGRRKAHERPVGGGAGWRPGEAGARSGLAWTELRRAGVLRGAEGEDAHGGVRPPPGADSGGCSTGPGSYPRPPLPSCEGASGRGSGGRAWGAAAGGGPAGCAQSPGRDEPPRVPGASRRGPGVSASAPRGHARAPRGRADCPRRVVPGGLRKRAPRGAGWA